MDPRTLLRRLLLRRCRVVTRRGPYVLVGNGERRAVVSLHRRPMPQEMALRIAADLDVDIRRPPIRCRPIAS